MFSLGGSGSARRERQGAPWLAFLPGSLTHGCICAGNETLNKRGSGPSQEEPKSAKEKALHT